MAEGDCRPRTQRGPPSAMGSDADLAGWGTGLVCSPSHYGSLHPGGEVCEPSNITCREQRPETAPQVRGSRAGPEPREKRRVPAEPQSTELGSLPVSLIPRKRHPAHARTFLSDLQPPQTCSWPP